MRFHHFARAALLVALGLQVCACAASNAALRSQPAGFFTVKDYPVTNDKLNGKITLKCAKIAGTQYKKATAANNESMPAEQECDSVSADLTALTSLSDTAQNDASKDVIDLLFALSDYNCSNFLNRAFSVRSSLDFASKLIADLATGASAGTVAVSPGVSAGFSGLNLLVGKTDTEFNSIYYADKTFDAMAKAIAAERTKRKTEIVTRRDATGYLLTDAISDARYYDDACSIRAGLDSLNAAADQSKNNQVQHAACVSNAPATGKHTMLMRMLQGMPASCP